LLCQREEYVYKFFTLGATLARVPVAAALISAGRPDSIYERGLTIASVGFLVWRRRNG
jgi:hypothetical protein